MRVQDLVDNPTLGIRVLYGDPEGLARGVTWTYTTDLPNPSRYLSRGLLVMTGLMWRREPTDSAGFVAAVAASGAAGLVAGEGLLGYVPDDVVDACRHHHLPLLAVAAHVSFVQITEHIAGELTQDRVMLLTARLVRQRQLLAEVAEGRALDEIVLQVARESQLSCWIVTATGRQVVAGSSVLDADDLDQITHTALAAPELPATSTGAISGGEPGYSVFAIAGRADDRLTAWFLVFGGDWTRWSPQILDAIRELEAIAALHKSHQESSRLAWQEISDAAIGLIDHPDPRAETATQVGRLGLDLTRPAVAVVAAFSGGPLRRREARWLLADAVVQLGEPIVGVDGDDAVALLAVDRNRGSERIGRVLGRTFARVAPGLSGEHLTIGISEPASVAALGGALNSARYAQRLGEHHPGSVQVVRSAEISSAVLLLNSVPDQLRRSFAEHVLGPVLDYDTRNASGLVATLRAYFDCSGSWSKTAERLQLHLNTVRYRIARVESLTQRDLAQMEDRMDLYLALQML